MVEINCFQFIHVLCLKIKDVFAKEAMRSEHFFVISNLNEAPSNLRKVWVNACMADTSHTITILPDGKLGKCNDYLESHFVGTLDEGITDEKMVQAFTLQREPLADCRSCALQPDCLRLQLCMEKEHCYVEERRIKVFRIQQMMLKTFEKNKAV